tara:strand:- start:2986 stop:4131 length:1146 start_codon:yes stop_codon:yes gene_type:complete
MSIITERWCALAGIITEQDDLQRDKRDLHVFDFDDTLGVTDSPTLVAAVEYSGGDPNDPKSYVPVKDLGDRVGAKVKGIQLPKNSDFQFSGLSGNEVRSNNKLDDAQAIVLDTEQYRDWKEKYIPSGDHVRLVVAPDIDAQIKSAGKRMSDMGTTGEIHVADFSPSSTIGTNVQPIDSMLDVFSTAESEGDATAVVTARKGETDLDSLGGGKIPATNAADIQDFLASEIGSNADVVYGAADFNPTDPATGKKDLIQRLAIKDDIDNVHFYDDDPENAKRVEQLCNDPELAGTEIDIYNYEYAKGAKPTTPTSSCTVGMKMSESQIRSLIRKTLLESMPKKKNNVGHLEYLFDEMYLDDYDGYGDYDEYYDDFDDDFDDYDD